MSSGASVSVLSDPLTTTPKGKPSAVLTEQPNPSPDSDHVTAKDGESKPLVTREGDEIFPKIEPEVKIIEDTIAIKTDDQLKPVENQASVLVQAPVLVPEQTLKEENVALVNIDEQKVATSHLTKESTNEIVEHSTPRLVTVEPTNQIVEPLAPSHATEELANQSVVPSAPALLELSETAQLAPREGVRSVEDVETSELLYPRLDSILQGNPIATVTTCMYLHVHVVLASNQAGMLFCVFYVYSNSSLCSL